MLKFNTLFRLREWWAFFSSAQTRYQVHSPFVFELVSALLEDSRKYYAFKDVEQLRQKMLHSDAVLQVRDYGTGAGGPQSLADIVRRAASSPTQGRMLFRLANHFSPERLLEIGASTGIGSLYLLAGARPKRFIGLEGSDELSQVARLNIEMLGFQKNVEIISGPFDSTLQAALERLGSVDMVFFDGNHRSGPTLEYFEKCLLFSGDKTVFVFDDMHWSADMTGAWALIQQHPRVRMTVDFFGLSLAFINPDFKVKQHFKVVPSRWKFWKIF